MKIYRTHLDLPLSARGAHVAIGNFDGVHRGHQAVLEKTRQAGAGPIGVLTFSPHPRAFFAPDAPHFCLMNSAARARRLAELSVDYLFELPFNRAMASLSPQDFVQSILCEGLGVASATVGADFCFGKGRAGGIADLRNFGATRGFEVHITDLLANEGDEISSTAIRNLLGEGAPDRAARLLGHWHRIEGIVEHGEKRGRDLGFPTANMGLGGLFVPKMGVYAVLVDVETGPYRGRYKGAASLGTRPMFGQNTANLETYLFDFEGDLYGQTLSVALVAFLRPELCFDGIEALVAHMHDDCERARAVLEAL